MRKNEHPVSSDKDRGKGGHRLLKSISWILTIALAAVISDWAVQGSHSVVARGLCAIRYFSAPPKSYPENSGWATYGVTELAATGKSFSLAPEGEQLTDEWFGATLRGPGLCNYRVDFDAAISGPLYPRWVTELGYGYAVGAAAHVDNDVPNGTTVQFDPPFRGLRTVELPVDPNAAGHNPHKYVFVIANHYCHWQLIVNGMNMTVSVNGNQYGTVRLTGTGSDDIILRIWDARLSVKNVKISKLRPQY
ncbi:MAG: hypothetical protein ABSF03_05755 [Streptosporangiaceae bacterium]|jgi:hypothetical protein